MRAYVSVDMEGMPGVFHGAQTSHRGFLHNEARRITTKIALTVAEALKTEEFDEVWIADAHWYMGNIVYEEMPDYVRLIRGSPRPLSMVCQIDRGFEAALFVGYHASAGTTASVLDHTISGAAFAEIRVNGEPASEFYLNSLIAGYYGVPVILVAGDDKLKGDVLSKAPWVEYVVFKESVARMSAVMKPLSRAVRELREAVGRAAVKLKMGTVSPLKVSGGLNVEVRLHKTHYADVANLLPHVRRIGPYTVRLLCDDIVEVYRTIQVLSLMVSGLDAMLRRLIE